jgi:hypothetical protein
MNEFNFGSLEVIDIPVTGPKPNGGSFILKEASGQAKAEFTNARTRCMTLQDGEVTGVSGVGGLEMLLVSLCLFKVDEEGIATGERVRKDTLKIWPGKVISKLFNKAKEISEIDQEDGDLESLRKQYRKLGEQIAKMEEDMAKNEQGSTETGSN